MTNYSRLTPVSRFLITLAIVGSLFYLFKTFLGSKSDTSELTMGNKSDAPILMTLAGSSTLGANMIPQIAKQFMGVELNAKNVKINKINASETDVVGTIDDVEKQIIITTEYFFFT
jgi:hypothetical protein